VDGTQAANQYLNLEPILVSSKYFENRFYPSEKMQLIFSSIIF